MQIDFSTREGRRQQGQLIQQAAEASGLSLEALAKEIGCSRALIYQYVSGATLAQADRIQQIAQRTGKSLASFYGGEETTSLSLGERLDALQTLLSAQISPPDFSTAQATSEQIITLARQSGDLHAEANARLRQVNLLLHQGEMARALAAIEQAMPFFRTHQLSAHLRATEQNQGHALLALGRIEEAEKCFQLLVKNGEWEARWQGLVSLAGIAEQRGEYRQALELLDEALLLKDMAPTLRAADILHLYVGGNLANVHLACGDFRVAACQAETAQDLALQQSNRDQYLESLLTIGVCRRWEGDLPASRRMLEGAARWARLSGDRGREALAAAELGRTLVEMGRLEEGRTQGKLALQLAIDTGARRAELAAQLALSESYLYDGIAAEARYHAAQARELSNYLDQRAAQAEALIALGEAQLLQSRELEAHESFACAAAYAEELGARLLALRAAIRLAELGEPITADSLLEQMRAVDAPALCWPTWFACGLLAEKQDDTAGAVQAYRKAIEGITTLRTTLADEPAGDSYLEARRRWEPYRRLADLLRRQNAADELATLQDDVNWPPLLTLLREK
ncbi:MAG: helix-turn-helix domain-containing protein [Armatimonadota bacterium]